MKKFLLLCTLSIMMFSCQKEFELPGDPDLPSEILAKAKITEEYQVDANYSVYDPCANEYIVLQGLISCKYVTTVDENIIKYNYTIAYDDVIGIGESSGKKYKTEYRHKTTVIVDITNNGFAILRNKEKARILYECEDGHKVNIDITVNYKPDKDGRAKVEKGQEYASVTCN